jgi:Zn-dependent protease with chaperone function
LLLGLYVTTLSAAAALFVAPILFVSYSIEHGNVVYVILTFSVGWISSALLLFGVLGARRPPFDPPGKELAPEEAPELFETVRQIAKQAGTAPPESIWLSPFPTMFVTEHGGWLGIGSERALVIGAPLLDWSTMQELSAVVAHEMGHFVGGDTRLCGVVSHTHALFRSLLMSMRKRPGNHGIYVHAALEFSHWFGTTLIGNYAKIYFRLLRPIDRRQEIAADALSVTLAGRDAAIRALENASTFGLLYGAYLDGPVRGAVHAGAMPTDLLDGFHAFRERIAERGELAKLVGLVRAKKTDPFDTHPALEQRIAAMRAVATDEESMASDDRPALVLLRKPKRHAKWLAESTRDRCVQSLNGIEYMPWGVIPEKALAPWIRRMAREVVEAMPPSVRGKKKMRSLPAAFAAFVREIESDCGAAFAAMVAPRVQQVVPHERPDVVIKLLGPVTCGLFQGALVARGAEVEQSLGEACLVFRHGGERVFAADVVRAAFEDGDLAPLRVWAERLGEKPLVAEGSPATSPA